MEFDEVFGEFFQIIRNGRALGMPGNLGSLPRREVGKEFLFKCGQLFGTFGNGVLNRDFFWTWISPIWQCALRDLSEVFQNPSIRARVGSLVQGGYWKATVDVPRRCSTSSKNSGVGEIPTLGNFGRLAVMFG